MRSYPLLVPPTSPITPSSRIGDVSYWAVHVSSAPATALSVPIFSPATEGTPPLELRSPNHPSPSLRNNRHRQQAHPLPPPQAAAAPAAAVPMRPPPRHRLRRTQQQQQQPQQQRQQRRQRRRRRRQRRPQQRQGTPGGGAQVRPTPPGGRGGSRKKARRTPAEQRAARGTVLTRAEADRSSGGPGREGRGGEWTRDTDVFDFYGRLGFGSSLFCAVFPG